MKVAILDDYQHAIRTLDCFGLLAGHEVQVRTVPPGDPCQELVDGVGGCRSRCGFSG